MSNTLVVIDTETGGLDPQKQSILSLGAVVLRGGEIIDEFYTLIVEDVIIAEPLALKVNGLSTQALLDGGSSPCRAVVSFEHWLRSHVPTGRVYLAGHNVSFDIGFVQRLYRLAGAKFEKLFSHRTLCTQTAALLLAEAGRIDGKLTSLDALCKSQNILIREPGVIAHNALQDARATAKLLTRFIGMIRNDQGYKQTEMELPPGPPSCS